MGPFDDLIAPLPTPDPLPEAAPMPTPTGQTPHGKLATIAALAAAISGGRASGFGGLLQGVQQAQRARDQENLARYQLEDQQRVRQNQLLQQQQQQAAQREEARQRMVESLVTDFQKRVPTMQSLDEYEQQLGMTASTLRNLVGSRLNDVALRQRYPFVAPKREKVASQALDQWLSLPNNKQLLEKNPEDAAKAVVMFDRDGDGIPERTPLTQLAEMAKRPFAQTADGMVLTPKGTEKADAASADAIYRDLHAQALAQGKQDTPDLRNLLREQALRKHKEAGTAPDPVLNEMRLMRIEEMKRRQNMPDLSPVQLSAANRLADDFTRDSKDFIQRGQSYGTVLAAAKDPSAAGDLSLIFAYMKMLDPGSVVREGEFATAQNATGVPSRIANVYNRLVNGERLNPTQRADFLNQAKKIFGAAKQRQDAIVRTYTTRAQRAKLPPELVVMDYGQGVEDTPPDPAVSAAAKLGIKP